MPDINEIQTPIGATIDPDQPPVIRKRGRPPKPASLRAPPRVTNQEPLRGEIEYSPEGRVVAYTSSGERVTRKRTSYNDDFYIPPEIIPLNMDYQWNRVEVYGQPDVTSQINMAENGWRPVPAGRHRGMYMPANWPENGDITRGGLRLEERPLILTEEARAEERAKAGKLMRDQQEQLGLTQKMPDGFSRDNPNLRRMERSGTSRQFAPAPDAPRPRLEIDPNA